MRRPALTAAVINGLEHALCVLEADYDHMASDDAQPPEVVAGVGRALQYLNALTAWHRIKAEGKE